MRTDKDFWQMTNAMFDIAEQRDCKYRLELLFEQNMILARGDFDYLIEFANFVEKRFWQSFSNDKCRYKATPVYLELWEKLENYVNTELSTDLRREYFNKT